MLFAFSPFRFRWPSEASRWLQEGPRGPQEGPKRAPRRPQERPRALQERPKRGPGSGFGGSRGGARIDAPLFFDRSPPRWPQEAPRRPQEVPKMAPRGPQEAPRRPPREPQEAAMRLQEAPKRPQEASGKPPRVVSGWAGGDTRSVKNCAPLQGERPQDHAELRFEQRPLHPCKLRLRTSF